MTVILVKIKEKFHPLHVKYGASSKNVNVDKIIRMSNALLKNFQNVEKYSSYRMDFFIMYHEVTSLSSALFIPRFELSNREEFRNVK
jgi:hypothetical protein